MKMSKFTTNYLFSKRILQVVESGFSRLEHYSSKGHKLVPMSTTRKMPEDPIDIQQKLQTFLVSMFQEFGVCNIVLLKSRLSNRKFYL
jgi:hypothetical protein